MITTYRAKAQHMDLSYSWQLNENFIFSDQINNVITENIANLPNIAGILISKDGKIIFENYYNNSFMEEIYPIWSVTKSFLSTIVGQAYDMQLIQNPDLPLSNFLTDDIDYLDNVTLSNLLTMTSGYLPTENYINATTYDLANADHLTSPGWFFYQNPPCHLISHVMYHNTGMTPYYFAEIHLFPHLGITSPFWEYGWNYINDGGKGLWLNLRDMSKLGQLYLQNGYSGDNQILSSEWIERATSSSVSTGLDPLSGYGYLFWIPDVQNTYFDDSFFMMGVGGQHIFVSPRHNLLIATHSYLYPENIDEHSDNLFLNIWNYLIPVFALGDYNEDTIIDIFDVLHIADLNLDGSTYNEQSDINMDGVNDEIDLFYLVDRLLQI